MDFKEVFENFPDPILLLDDGGKLKGVNKAALDKLGFEKNELVGVPLGEAPFFSAEAARKAEDNFERRKEGEEAPPYRLQLASRSGEELVCEINVGVFGPEGDLGGVVAVLRDLNERREIEEELKKSEKRYRTRAEEAPIGIVTCDREGNINYVNPQLLEILGSTDLEETKNINLLEFPPLKERGLADDLKYCLENSESLTSEKEYETKWGKRVYLRYHITPRGGDSLSGAQIIVDDITARKEIEFKLRKLHETVDRLQTCDSKGDLCEKAVRDLEGVLGFDLCTIYLMEEGKLKPKAASHDRDPDRLEEYSPGEALAGSTFSEGKTYWGDDVGEEEKARPVHPEVKSYLSIPIGDQGVLQAGSIEKGYFDQKDIELAEILTNHLREEFKRIALQKELKQQAIKDPLTGLFNRRHFNKTLEKEVARCRRYDHCLGFIMMDVNRFKEINDRYSHLKGDKVLKEVARLLRQNLRSADTIFRYGGDEFLALLLGKEDGKIRQSFSRLEEVMEAWNQENDLVDFPVTLAKGISCWCPEGERGVEEALKEADEKMYEDKKGS